MNPKQTLENALHAFVVSQSPAIPNIYRGLENSVDINNQEDANIEPQTLVVPCIWVEADNDFVESIPFTGNWEGHATIAVVADAHNTTGSAFDALCKPVFALFNTDTIAADLSGALDDFTCFFFNVESFTHSVSDGGNWIASIRAKIVFCESDL